MTHSPPQTSTTLLSRVSEPGDEAACGEFVERYSALVREAAKTKRIGPQDSEDVLQEVMLAAIDGLRNHAYDRARGRFRPWLRGLISHKITDVQRSIHRLIRPRGPAPADARSVVCLRGGGPDEALDPRSLPAAPSEAEVQELIHRVARAFNEIRSEVEPQTFQAFDLYVLKERPPAEVAALLGMSRGNVYLAKNRILARLREKLGG